MYRRECRGRHDFNFTQGRIDAAGGCSQLERQHDLYSVGILHETRVVDALHAVAMTCRIPGISRSTPRGCEIHGRRVRLVLGEAGITGVEGSGPVITDCAPAALTMPALWRACHGPRRATMAGLAVIARCSRLRHRCFGGQAKVQTMYRGPRSRACFSGWYCLVWGHPSHQFGPKQALWKLRAATKNARDHRGGRG